MIYDLVIFDLDGTLIDTIADLGEAVNYALQKRGWPLHSIEEYKGMVGHGVRNLVIAAMPEDKREDAIIDACLADFKEYYTAHIDVHTRPYPGMQDLVRDLDAAGVKLAVASNKFQSGAEHLVKEFFPQPFVAILGDRPGAPLKPDPQIVAEVMAAATERVPRGVKTGFGFFRSVEKNKSCGAADDVAAKAVLVGDSATDMRTAANGGIDSIGVSWGFRPRADLEPLAGHVVDTVDELRSLLGLPD